MSDERSRIPPPESLLKPLELPEKLLLGPGPSNPPPEVYKAMLQPMQGYLHKETLQVMQEIRQGLQYLFQTKNSLVFCVSGTGHAGMECAFVNLLEHNDPVLILENGLWGQRAAEMCRRMGKILEFCKKIFILK